MQKTVAVQPEVEFVELALHDLQNTVAVLDSSVRLLTIADGSIEFVSTARDAQIAVRRIQQYIDHLVTSERVSRSGALAHRVRVRLGTALEELADDYSHHVGTWELSLDLDLPAEEELTVLADEVLLRRALQNLLENCLRHNRRKGRVLIRLAARGGSAELRFCNDGEPIAPHDREHIFDKYVGNKMRGTAGLGLYFCRAVARAHGGSIEIEDDPAWPVCVLLRLPRIGGADAVAFP